MNVLVACEQSQKVCFEFRRKGHNAFSCDLLECSGGYPCFHIKADCLEILRGGCFRTQDGYEHYVAKWDLLIAHPPCTYLTTAGNSCYSLKRNTEEKVNARIVKRNDAANFFLELALSDIERKCIENPVGYMNTHYRKPDQIIHPYYFANDIYDTENYNLKRTCLWLYNLPLLERKTYLPKPTPIYYRSSGEHKGKAIYWTEGFRGKDRANGRSVTFSGIAKAMANQWG